MCVRPGARGCAGVCARIRERKSPNIPAYRGFSSYYTLKSQCGITVPHYLCGKSALERSVFRVVGLKMLTRNGASIHSATEKLAMDHALLVGLGDAPNAVSTFPILSILFHTKTFHR